MAKKRLLILGTRGIPANHGGFETFAEHISTFLVNSGWNVTVYCHDDASNDSRASTREDTLNGIHRVIIQTRSGGPWGSVIFDWLCIVDALKRNGTLLILGYNTGIFAFIPRILRRHVLINMDGIEWKRTKWSRCVKVWFWINEIFASLAGNTLIADHPGIEQHLNRWGRRNNIAVIPYGADAVLDASAEPLLSYGLKKDEYCIMVCRLEPENFVLEIVEAFSAQKRGLKLVILGRLDEQIQYHASIVAAAGPEVLFLGPIYDKQILNSLRFHALAYCHGHTVGGTNPSLIEAMAAGNAIMAHDNEFNRWTAGERQFYFRDRETCAATFEAIAIDVEAVKLARQSARERFEDTFQLGMINTAYEQLLLKGRVPQSGVAGSAQADGEARARLGAWRRA